SDLRLSAAERDFFAALDRVVYTNPFTDGRARLIESLVPDASPEDLLRNREALAKIVEPRLQLWQDAQKRSRLSDEDTYLLRSAFLYICYHRHVPAIDALIAQQLTSGEPPESAGVAEGVLADFAGWGLPAEMAIHHLGFFFQLRRAFHFIVVS